MHLSSSPQETHQFGIEIGESRKSGAVLALVGELGAGKTEFVKGVVEGAGCKLDVTSPTFTLINEYPGRHRLIHVDLYRIEYIAELEEIGLDEVLNRDAVIAIEWADKLPEGSLPDHLTFQFKIISEESRKIDIFAYGHPENNLLKAVEKRIHTELKGKPRN